MWTFKQQENLLAWPQEAYHPRHTRSLVHRGGGGIPCPGWGTSSPTPLPPSRAGPGTALSTGPVIGLVYPQKAPGTKGWEGTWDQRPEYPPPPHPGGQANKLKRCVVEFLFFSCKGLCTVYIFLAGWLLLFTASEDSIFKSLIRKKILNPTNKTDCADKDR